LLQILEEMKGLSGKDSARLMWGASRLYQLGPNGKAAIPFLQGLLTSGASEVYCEAARALQRIGADKEVIVPPLLPRLRETAGNARLNVASVILSSDPTNPEAITAMVEIVRAGSPFAGLAIRELAAAGPAARSAIPVLRQVGATSRDKTLRSTAKEALRQIEAAGK
jgi:hypothetical protein